MMLGPAIERFTQYLSAERNMAPRTVQAYRYDLGRLAAHLVEKREGKPPRVDQVDAYDLKDYLAHLKEDRGSKPATVGRVISTIRVFFQFLTELGECRVNPARVLHTPKRPKKLPVYLTATEAHDIMSAPDPDHQDAARDRTILLLLIMTGMRLSELVGLDLESVDFERNTVKVFGKGRKERLIPLNASARRMLQEWVAGRPASREGCRALFLSRHGDRISRRTVQYLVRKAVKAKGLDPRISPHKLRHTFATTLYAEAVDLRDIQELLGHASIASTSVYTHTNVDKVRAAVNKLRLK